MLSWPVATAAESRHGVVHADTGQRAQTEDRHQCGAAEQQAHLHVLGHHDGLQPAERRVGHREEREHDDRRDHRHAEEALEDLGRGEEADADMDQQRADESDDREKRSAPPGNSAAP